ncbi:spermidine synthase [Stackebrandtia nassauensis]|uniref:Spermidine synthase-like protein n=1 Tax=Stackebrandtia nassauensis (strain DSM 44728 / CIP 108903 / NRRL B-16338 / NBRC 102104 / LLR-40K-21) TaxID=446470 RepID=D3Q709_STANL|nr:fused MFS/spermidine synthase [Stackebrandtia nassauensis]ADD40408.1 Spermidine synthase-like protein [Stackebrandtia nassauensis DSM 44728]
MGETEQPKVLASTQVATGPARIIADPHRELGRFLEVGGFAQSYVKLDEPTFLWADYSMWVATVIDTVGAKDAPLRVLHLGGGGMTLPRYVHGVRPNAIQTVVEMDGPLVEFVREHLPLPEGSRVDIVVGDAVEVLAGLPDAEFDIVISDVYAANQTPRGTACLEYAQQLSRVLRPEGTCVVNVLDVEGLVMTRLHAAALNTVFEDLCVVSAHTPNVKRFLNIVMAATNSASGLPYPAISDAAVHHDTEVALIHGDDLAPVIAGVEPLRAQD